MNGTPTPTTAQLRAIKARIERAVQNDPVDALLADYRALTIEDVLRVDVHWYTGWSNTTKPARSGYVEPLFRTNRMRIKPLRVLRGFLYRLEQGVAEPETNARIWQHVSRPGHGVVYNLHSSNGRATGSGYFGGLGWKPQALRKRDKGMSCAAQDTVCRIWGWDGGNTGFWDGPSGPYLWERADGRFVTADHDAWGDPTLIDLVWRTSDQRTET